MKFAVLVLLCVLGGCASGQVPVAKSSFKRVSEAAAHQAKLNDRSSPGINRIKVFDPIVELVGHSLVDDPEQLDHWQRAISSSVTSLILDDMQASGFTVSHPQRDENRGTADKPLISRLVRNMNRIRNGSVSATRPQLIPTVAALAHRLSEGDVNGLLIGKYSGWIKSPGLSVKERITHFLYRLVTFGFASTEPVAESSVDVVFYLIDARSGELLWGAEGTTELARATSLTSKLLGDPGLEVLGNGFVQDAGLAQRSTGKP